MIFKYGQSFSFAKGTTVIGKIIKAGQLLYENFKDILISGVPPLTLLNCKGADLSLCYIDGNSIQYKNLIDIYNGTMVGACYGIDISNLVIGETYTFISNETIDSFKISNHYTGHNSVAASGVSNFTFTMTKNSSIASSATQYLFIKYKGAWVTKPDTIERCNLQIAEKVPTPTTPMEIESVGEKTNNLFNWSAITNPKIVITNNGQRIAMPVMTSGNGYTGTNATFHSAFPDLKAGDVVTLHFNTTSQYQNFIYGTNVGTWRSGETKTVTEDMLNAPLVLYGNNYDKGETEQVIITDFQLVKGETIPDYEPYGYKIPVITTDENLYNGGDVKWSGHYKRINLNNPLKAGITYIFVADVTSTDTDADKCLVYDVTNKTSLGLITRGTRQTLKITPISDCPTLEFYCSNNFANSNGDSASFCNLKIHTKEITTNIYLNEPLRKIGDVSDEIDVVDKRVTRYIKYREFSENDSWSVYTAISKHFQITVGDNSFSSITNYVMSNYYTANKLNNAYYTNNDYAVMSVDGSRIRFKNKDCTTLDDWKNWIASLDEKLYVIYVLATPTEETIEMPNIPTIKGTTILEIDTKIQPSNMVVIYKGK